MICRAFFLVHSSALLLMLHRAVLILVFRTNPIMTNSALLNVHSIAHLLYLGHAMLVFDIIALLLIRGTALLLVLGHCLVFGVTLLVSLGRDIRSIYGNSQQNIGESKRFAADDIHPS